MSLAVNKRRVIINKLRAYFNGAPRSKAFQHMLNISASVQFSGLPDDMRTLKWRKWWDPVIVSVLSQIDYDSWAEDTYNTMIEVIEASTGHREHSNELVLLDDDVTYCLVRFPYQIDLIREIMEEFLPELRMEIVEIGPEDTMVVLTAETYVDSMMMRR
jgi:hypothetical protein